MQSHRRASSRSSVYCSFLDRLLVCVLVGAIAFAPSPALLAHTAPSPIPVEREEGAGGTAGIVIGVIGVVVSLAGIGISLLDADNVEVGDIQIDLAENHFHVGDKRKLTVTADVSHGNIDGSDRGSVEFYVTVGGRTRMYDESVTGSSVGGNGRQRYSMELDVEGIDHGEETIEVKVDVTGENWGLLWDSFAKRSKTQRKTVGVLFPYSRPTLTPPDPLVFEHNGPGPHAMKIKNHSSKSGWINSNVVASASANNVDTPAGTDFGPPSETTLVLGETHHDGPRHPGSAVQVPFTWQAQGLNISLSSGTWTDEAFSESQGIDICVDRGEEEEEEEPEETEEDGPRRESSGERGTGTNRQSDSTGDRRAGTGVRFVDRLTGDPTDYFVSDDGSVAWENLLLGPTFDVILNPGGLNPFYDETIFPNVPVEVFEDPGLVELNFVEREAPVIIGNIVASDGGELAVHVSSRTPKGEDRFLCAMGEGRFLLQGRGMFEFGGEESLLVIEPVPLPNRTLLLREPILIPFDATGGLVNLGDIEIPVLERLDIPEILFMGSYLSPEGKPVRGLELEVLSPTGEVIQRIQTDPKGFFQTIVPTGPATVRALHLEKLGFRNEQPQEVDFGASGQKLLDIGQRTLRQPCVDDADSQCAQVFVEGPQDNLP
ncbi:MAG: hypothetical protein AAF517_00770, partial [Planctomycetota bacterium]